MKNYILLLAFLWVCGNELSAQDVVMDGGEAFVMDYYTDGVLLQAQKNRYITRDFQNGQTGKRPTIFSNSNFNDYDSKCGAVVGFANRFWFIGGEGTVNNKPYQEVGTILTGTVTADGVLHDLRKCRSLPFSAMHGRALIMKNKIYYLGGTNHNELVSAEILSEGELGEWVTLTSYPINVAAGGFVYYKGCFYANGKSTWKRGSNKMYALRVDETEIAKKWEQVDSPEEAQGYLFVCSDVLYYFDEISGNIYKTEQESNSIQLKDWRVTGKMPCPPKTEGVTVTEVAGGWLFHGGYLPPKESGEFGGFFGGVFLPFSAVK